MRYPITRNGYNKLKKELNYLMNTEKVRIMDALKTARAHGDLKENGEYHSAKEEYNQLMNKVIQLNNKLQSSFIMEIKKGTGKVEFGSIVKLKVTKHDKTVENTELQLVGFAEADIFNKQISTQSPLGKQLLGKQVGNIINITVSDKITIYEILSIE